MWPVPLLLLKIRSECIPAPPWLSEVQLSHVVAHNPALVETLRRRIIQLYSFYDQAECFYVFM